LSGVPVAPQLRSEGAEARGDSQQQGSFVRTPIVFTNLRNAEDSAKLVVDQHRNGERTFHSRGLCGRSRLPGGIRLEIAQCDWLPSLGRQSGDSFSNGNRRHDRGDLWRNIVMRPQFQQAAFLVEPMDRPGLCAEMPEDLLQRCRDVSSGERCLDGGRDGSRHGPILVFAAVVAMLGCGAISARHSWASTQPWWAMLPDRLKRIIDVKHEELARLLPRAQHLRAAAVQRDEFRGFAAALDRGRDDENFPLALGLIAEVKKASPSVGVIDPNFDYMGIAKAYEEAGAHCLSILTDEQFFQGSLRYLTRIRAQSTLPCLRKDFIIHEAQIWEASVAGADAILLIVAALDQPTLERLFKEAETFQLDALVEVHTREELDRALDLGAKLIGINNRNLHTFEVDLATTEELSEEVPDDVILISESGLKERADAQRMFDSGCNAILVGESLMRAGIEGIGHQVAALLDVKPTKPE
jgi:indole-3-glycerol phosphate synthase